MDPTFGCLLNLCMIALEKINRIVFHYSEGFANSKENDAELWFPHPLPAPRIHTVTIRTETQFTSLPHPRSARMSAFYSRDVRLSLSQSQTHRPTHWHTNVDFQNPKTPLPKFLTLGPLSYSVRVRGLFRPCWEERAGCLLGVCAAVKIPYFSLLSNPRTSSPLAMEYLSADLQGIEGNAQGASRDLHRLSLSQRWARSGEGACLWPPPAVASGGVLQNIPRTQLARPALLQRSQRESRGSPSGTLSLRLNPTGLGFYLQQLPAGNKHTMFYTFEPGSQ